MRRSTPRLFALLALLASLCVTLALGTAVAEPDASLKGSVNRPPGVAVNNNAPPSTTLSNTTLNFNRRDVEIGAFLLAYQSQMARDARANRQFAERQASLANEARQARLQAQSNAIDQGMREARDRNETAMAQASNEMAMGIVSGMPSLVMAQGVNLAGADLPAQSRASLNDNGAACARACRADARCRAFSWVRPGVQGSAAQCWLKSGLPAAHTDANVTSGFFERN